MTNSSRFHTSGKDRSWTDAITNQVLLHGLDIVSYVRWVESRSARIESVIPQFLHEFTHHWCFNSLVGKTLALLRMRAQYRSLFRPAGQREDLVCLDLVRHEVAKEVLKPITEGLALFAEFDLVSGSRSIQSQTLSALAMCFGFGLEDDEGKLRPELSHLALLQNTRLNPEFLETRKAPLYFMPFVDNEAYLQGYLSLKAIHARQRMTVGAFHDPEFFLCYVRAYFFEDPILVSLLLSPETNEIKAANAIAGHLQKKIARLAEAKDLESQVNAFEKRVLAGEEFLDTLGADQSEIREGRSRSEAALNELMMERHPEYENADLLLGAILANIQYRGIFEVGKVPVRVSSNTNQLEIVGSEETFIDLHLPNVDLHGGESGEVLIVLPSSSEILAKVLILDEEVYILKTWGLQNEGTIEAVKGFAQTRKLYHTVFETLESTLTDLLEESWIKIVLDHTQRDSINKIPLFYSDIATLNVSDNNFRAVKQKLLSDGFRSFIGDDPDIARALAAVGLANTVSSSIPTVRGLATSMMGITNESLDTVIAAKNPETTFPLVISDEKNVWSLV